MGGLFICIMLLVVLIVGAFFRCDLIEGQIEKLQKMVEKYHEEITGDSKKLD